MKKTRIAHAEIHEPLEEAVRFAEDGVTRPLHRVDQQNVVDVPEVEMIAIDEGQGVERGDDEQRTRYRQPHEPREPAWNDEACLDRVQSP